METLEVTEHEHPLKLIDLQLEYPLYYEEEEEEEEDDDDEGGDPITKEGFHGVNCEKCLQEINMYHRYYYKCIIGSSCDFSLHKFCADLSTRLDHSHPHTLHMVSYPYGTLNICKSHDKCALEVGKNIIHHPCHPHLLMCLNPKLILCECSACGKEHKGMFYQCPTCVGFTIHKECAFLPKTLLIQERTDSAFHHTHPLTISYSFSKQDQRDKYYPRCRVCRHNFRDMENLWIYKCDKCMFYAHVDCATRVPPAGAGKTIKNYKDAEHPNVLHLPFPDETYNIRKHLFSQGIPTRHENNHKIYIQHMSHQHPLILVDERTQCGGETSSLKKINSWLLKCHKPWKLCNGCLRPIISTMSFYICVESCDFLLHEWCTRLSAKMENHPGHPQHTLHLMLSNILPLFFGVFNCGVCHLPCNGFAYCCIKCEYYVDVTCGSLPAKITHEAHPNHILSLVQKAYAFAICEMCLEPLVDDYSHQLFFTCNDCDIYIHPACALLLSETIRHKYDKHPMHLSYLPIENHKSRYFCEICEHDMDPHRAFYHCKYCAQSVHTACAPLKLQCETDTYSYYMTGVYYFVNMKFGGTFKSIGHPHPLSFAQGIVLDGEHCDLCYLRLQYKMILKCVKCKFAIHYNCCERLNTMF